MDFVSADRSRDAEFQAGLKNYNFGVSELNRNITKDITDDKNTERQTDRTIDSDETQTRILDATGGASAIASATATFKNYKAYGDKIAEGVKKAQKVAGDTAEKIQQAKPTTEVPEPTTEAPKPPTAPPEESGGGALSNSAEAEKLEQAGEETTNLVKTGEETGSMIGKVGSKALKGVGVLGAVAGMGMAIESDANGGWAKKSLADKFGNGAEIGGAALDIVGAGLEATGIGVPFGLALQGFGTLLQLGSGIEGEISQASDVTTAKKEAQATEQEAESEEAKPQQTVEGVSSAGAGQLGVARQQQN